MSDTTPRDQLVVISRRIPPFSGRIGASKQSGPGGATNTVTPGLTPTKEGLMTQRTRTCTVEGCDKANYARTYCHAHYRRWQRHGDPLGGGPSHVNGAVKGNCTIEGCDRIEKARGLCQRHYLRARRDGTLSVIDRSTSDRSSKREAQERFWEKVDTSGGDDACWEWRAYKDSKGYGKFNPSYPSTPMLAHRFAYEAVNKTRIPSGLVVRRLFTDEGVGHVARSGGASVWGEGSRSSEDGGSYTPISKDLDMYDATVGGRADLFDHPDLTAFCRLDVLGLEAVGQRLEPDRAVLACRVVEPDQWCRRCGCQGVPRDPGTGP